MILLTLALFAAPAALPVAEPQRRPRTTVRHARARILRTAIPLPIIQPPRDPNAKYRVTDTENRIDFKTRVVERGAFQNCATTGPSICPSKGMPILQSAPQ